ncbi:MAG: DNA polymerase III subunit alpha [Bdellovibrionales bacterium]|nr:DNA polymerase III subunit alpha [Bdellovibrionales bacterium]
MSEIPFAHLHLHTQYSLLDGLNRIDEVLKRAAGLSQPAIAITDHGNMHGAVQFYSSAQKAGIKPIIGCELYVTSGSRFDKIPVGHGGEGSYHLTVLAASKEGYKNLCRLVSLAYREGFYFKPRVDHELLQRYSDGLIVLSGCLGSELGQAALNEQLDVARERVDFYAKTFGDRYYLEVQPHPIAEQRKLNSLVSELARDKGIPIVASTDCHYLSADDHFAQEVLMCISTGKQITDPDRIRHVGLTLHLKTGTEMYKEFGDFKYVDEALRNTVEIGERCNVEFDFSTYYMPKFDPPKGKTLEELMEQDAREGLLTRLELIRQGKDDFSEQPYWDRLDEELALINKMGFAGYFLVVSDFIVWAKENNIPVGPGRGSAAGSLVAYALQITELDPIEHKLLFERFLNPERVSLPDIDVDFCINGRDKVIHYVVDKYGKENVAQIATFGTLKAKAAIKDVGRALGKSYAETDKVAQLVPAPRQGFDFSLEEAIKMEPKLKAYAESEGEELITLAMKVEGLTRHSSTHAAGVVIGDRPLTEFLPMMVDKEGNDVTQFSMKDVEKIGLVKFDFLGLKTLTVIYTALRLISEGRGEDVDLSSLPLNDKATYEMLCAGKTTGVFQLESSGITEMTMRLKPTGFDDLVAILALYRPGPLDSGMAEHYIERKNGREETEYLHPLMEDILADTYGIILYQEQIMQLARELAGYSLAEADLLRRAMGKKIPEEMAAQRTRFMEGALEKKIDEKAAKEIFDQMETFARYGFNRSHSAAYALISFQTAYLKAHFPVEFMAALMSLEMDDSDKTLKNLNECRKQKITVLPPDVNLSLSDFSVQESCIRYGLSAVKGVGEKAVEVVVAARSEGGEFQSLEDFVERVDLKTINRRVLESFVKCGAFDSCGENRRSMFERLDDVIRAGQLLQREQDTNQIGLFGGDEVMQSIPRKSINHPEWPTNKRLAFEREALGFYISGHPLSKYTEMLLSIGARPVGELKKLATGSQVRVGGVITALRLRNTKKGDRYASFLFEDPSGSIDSIAWPDTYRNIASLMVADEPLVATGRLDITDERANFIVDSMESIFDCREKSASKGVMKLSQKEPTKERLQALVGMFASYPGDCPIEMMIEFETGEIAIQLKDENENPILVQITEDLCDEAEQIFGRPVLSFQS